MPSIKRKATEFTEDGPLLDVKTYKDLQSAYAKLEKELAETKQKLLEMETQVEKLKGAKPPAEESDFSDEESLPNDDPWTIKYKELRQHRIIKGNCVVANTGPNSKLGNWLLNQKKAKSGKYGRKITQEQVTKLDGLGINCGKAFPVPVTWDAHFEDLQKYHKAMGNCNVHISMAEPSPLAKWVSNQRSEFKRFKKGKDTLLTMDQIEQMNGIGFNWKGPRLS